MSVVDMSPRQQSPAGSPLTSHVVRDAWEGMSDEDAEQEVNSSTVCIIIVVHWSQIRDYDMIAKNSWLLSEGNSRVSPLTIADCTQIYGRASRKITQNFAGDIVSCTYYTHCPSHE